MDQKFGTPPSEEVRQIMERIQAEQNAVAQDPANEELRKFIESLQINAPPPKPLTS